MRIEACSFSQILGTPRNTVGAISLKSSWIVRRLSAKLTVIPSESGRKTEKICSATWHSGRYDTTESDARMPVASITPAAWARIFRWVIMAPFGNPVVPDV